MLPEIEFILYVKNQQKSTDFYSKILDSTPSLYVPGITEFKLSENCKLGLMPEDGIAKIIAKNAPNPALGNGIPRCELYLKVDTIEINFFKSTAIGCKIIDAIAPRDRGDNVGYLSDLDGHIIAFASKTLN